MGSFKKNYIIKTLFQKKLNSSIEPFFFFKKNLSPLQGKLQQIPQLRPIQLAKRKR
jgi:hypothetical protein